MMYCNINCVKCNIIECPLYNEKEENGCEKFISIEQCKLYQRINKCDIEAEAILIMEES